MGIRLLAGRTFGPADDRDTPGVAVVPAVMVRRVFPELDDPTAAVGRTIYVGPPSDPDNAAEIVGVVENVRYRNLTQDLMAEPNSPDVFFSMRQVPFRSHEVVLRSEQPLAALLPRIREAVAELDPDLPLFLPQSLREAWRAQTATPRFAAFLMGLFGVLALSLACVGVYGVLAFAVGQRGREIAVRRALGAEATDVARSVVWDGVRLAAVGLVVGGVAAGLGTRYLEDFLFEVGRGDPVTYGAGAGLMLLVVLAASSVPAWRATRKDPVEALSAE